MLFKLWTMNIIFALIFIALSISGLNNTVVLLIHLALPFLLITKAIKVTMFTNRMKRVYDDYRRLYTILRDTPNLKDKTANILKNVLDYETTLSWANVLLSSKIYNNNELDIIRKME